jgi:uroporphyrin-3 C-methyltransferase
MPDYMEITSQLDSLQQEIASLPLRGAAPATTGSEQAAGDGWWEKVKGVFSNLVTVRRSTDEENKRISLQDKDFIRQRVWLQLEIAHLSLMRRDQEAFRASLKRVQESLSTWFDSGDSAFQAVKQGIDDLMAIEVKVDVPDITAPWSTLRLLRANQIRSAPAPAPAPAPQQQVPVNEPETEAVEG